MSRRGTRLHGFLLNYLCFLYPFILVYMTYSQIYTATLLCF